MSLINLDYPLDVQWWKGYASSVKSLAEPYYDQRYDVRVEEWLTFVPEINSQILKIQEDFSVVGKPRLYWLSPRSCIPEHRDNGTLCSLNFIISDDPAPITIEGKELIYRQALLDTTKLHGVNNIDSERIMFKLSIYNETFDDLATRIPFKAC